MTELTRFLRAGQHRARQAWASFPSLRALLLLWLPATAAAAAVALPVVYLGIRASASAEAWLLLTRPQTLQTLGRTLWLGMWVTLLSIGIAVPIAWLTTRTDLPFRRLWSVLTPLPLVVPSYVGAYLFASVLGPRGLLQSILEEPLGITRLPNLYGFPGALLVLTLLNYPFVLLSVRAALERMDPVLEEVSRGLGYNAWSTFWRVVLPQLRPAVTVGSLLVILYVLRDFGAVAIMRYNTLTRVIYTQYTSTFDRSAAAVLSCLLVLVSALILWGELRTRSRAQYASSARSGRAAPKLPLGAWRWPALIFCGGVVFLALVLPAGTLLFWLLRGMAAGEVFPGLWEAGGNSIVASALAALVTIVAALPIAILEVRRPSRLSRVLERISYISFALPGIVVALALVFFGVNFMLPLYQTLAMLVFAYGVLYLPQAVGMLRSSLLQIHPSMEEAGRSLGKRPLEVFRRITLPLLRPGVVMGLALVMLTAMKELPATLILAPIGFKTLSTAVWSSVSEAFFARAAAPALLLILLSSIPLAILELRKDSLRTDRNTR